MSKGLEALKRIKSRYNDRVCIDILEDFDLVEKELKALEIIAKEIGINAIIYGGFGYLLTDEQKDLLKEVLYEKETS